MMRGHILYFCGRSIHYYHPQVAKTSKREVKSNQKYMEFQVSSKTPTTTDSDTHKVSEQFQSGIIPKLHLFGDKKNSMGNVLK